MFCISEGVYNICEVEDLIEKCNKFRLRLGNRENKLTARTKENTLKLLTPDLTEIECKQLIRL